MISAASLLQDRDSGGTVGFAGDLPLDVLKRRVAHRRHTLAVQVASYAIGAAVLMVYASAGTVTILDPLDLLPVRCQPDRRLRDPV